MDIGIEESWERAGPPLFPSLRQPHDPKVFDSEQLALIWMGPNDHVVLRRPPHPALLHYLEEKGFALPNMHVLNSDVEAVDPTECASLRDRLSEGKIALRPYVVTKTAQEIAERYGVQLLGGHWQDVMNCNHKVQQHLLLKRHDVPLPQGRVFDGAADLLSYLERTGTAALGHVLKTPYGASGKALFRLNQADKLEQLMQVLRKQQLRGDEVLLMLLERWYETRRSLSYTLRLDGEQGRVDFVREQIVVDGVYRGFRYFRSDMSEQQERLAHHAGTISQALRSAGLRDVANIDAIETVNGTLFPAIDVNARLSLAMYFERCINKHPHHCALYFDVSLGGSVVSVLDLSRQLEAHLGAEILVASISRPDRRGMSRVFVLFSGADQPTLGQTIRAWCSRMSIPEGNIPGLFSGMPGHDVAS